jgi:hypothetical protein
MSPQFNFPPNQNISQYFSLRSVGKFAALDRTAWLMGHLTWRFVSTLITKTSCKSTAVNTLHVIVIWSFSASMSLQNSKTLQDGTQPTSLKFVNLHFNPILIRREESPTPPSRWDPHQQSRAFPVSPVLVPRLPCLCSLKTEHAFIHLLFPVTPSVWGGVHVSRRRVLSSFHLMFPFRNRISFSSFLNWKFRWCEQSNLREISVPFVCWNRWN